MPVHDHFKPVRQAKAKVEVVKQIHKLCAQVPLGLSVWGGGRGLGCLLGVAGWGGGLRVEGRKQVRKLCAHVPLHLARFRVMGVGSRVEGRGEEASRLASTALRSPSLLMCVHVYCLLEFIRRFRLVTD